MQVSLISCETNSKSSKTGHPSPKLFQTSGTQFSYRDDIEMNGGILATSYDRFKALKPAPKPLMLQFCPFEVISAHFEIK